MREPDVPGGMGSVEQRNLGMTIPIMKMEKMFEQGTSDEIFFECGDINAKKDEHIKQIHYQQLCKKTALIKLCEKSWKIIHLPWGVI